MKDPYIQENGTLKNKLGIEEYDDLNKAEKDIGFVKLIGSFRKVGYLSTK